MTRTEVGVAEREGRRDEDKVGAARDGYGRCAASTAPRILVVAAAAAEQV